MVLRILIILSLTAVSAVSHAQADASGAFYDKNSTRNVFGPRPEVNPQPEMKYFPEKPVFVLEQEKKAEGAGTKTAAKEEPAKSIIEEFGDPETDVPVLAIAEAPKPFKGMMKSLQDGNDDLAYRYAKQYARYLRDFQERTSRVAGLTQLAMVSEGTVQEASVKGTTLVQRDYDKLTRDLDEQAKAQRSTLMKLDPKAREMIERAAAEEDSQSADAATALNETEQPTEIQHTMAQLASRRIPVDPKGEVDVYFFFRPTDDRSLQMFPLVNAVAQDNGLDQRIQFTGVSLEQVPDQQLTSIRAAAGIVFPLESEKGLAAALKVRRSPSLVFVARGTGEALVEEGPRSQAFVTEVVRRMQSGVRQ